jgi:sugar-specific transcriptional regulator TrmB
MKTRDQVCFEEESNQKESGILLENPTNLLFKFGLSPNQSKVYLYLNKMGIKTASQLSKTLDIPRTETYHLLKTLQEKGCIFRIYEKPMKFGAVSIEDFLENWIISEKNKIKKLEKTLFVIKKLKLSSTFITNAQKVC